MRQPTGSSSSSNSRPNQGGPNARPEPVAPFTAATTPKVISQTVDASGASKLAGITVD
ncbi:hypothetical protein [Mycobacterium sp.]|uniref:hypothetical protein n=1 Tax=Mycobacterium sp. TaxID=1785 RepID=UPI0033413A28